MKFIIIGMLFSLFTVALAKDCVVVDPNLKAIERELASIEDTDELIYNETESGKIKYIEDHELKDFGL